MGLFPVAGQGIYLIGSPLFKEVVLDLGNRTFTIEATHNSDDAIYVQSAILNDVPLDRAYLTHREFAEGGRLVLNMGTVPSDWARDVRPPSYS
jgi:putative alpha-1,2-mannosidase